MTKSGADRAKTDADVAARVASLRLQHFRSYGDARFTFADGVNIIVGPNASGKTNILEAVLVAALGSSFRARDAELMQTGAEWTRLDVEANGKARVVKLQTAPNGTSAKSFEIDGQSLARLHLNRTIPAVLFEPDHLLLFTGSPDARRVFLDDLLEQIEPSFGPIRRHYRRVLAQRNALLKKQPHDVREQLFVWNLRLSELGGQIAVRRMGLISQMNEQLGNVYAQIAGRTHDVRLRYVSSNDSEQYESALLKRLETNVDLDIARGFTGAGPHRDDIVAEIDSQPMADVASRGELRTLVLALKMLELQLLETARGARPLLLLDDVFSELDAKRRQALTHFVRDYQTFITTTDADVVAHHFASSNIIRL
ncbi:MAG TPA: DNA replication/repair protein RecF [Candidatus Saccharimonadales bacterium]